MPSITIWNRLEPRPRSTSVARSLAAMIRDPAWMLARQWQFGEFDAVDAGSPALATIQTSTTKLQTWRPQDGAASPIDGSAPLEKLVASEAITPTLTIRAELGFYFEDLLTGPQLAKVIADFRKTYPIDLNAQDDADVESSRFRSVVSGRVTDGHKLFVAAAAAAPNLPVTPVVAPAQQGVVKNALAKFIAWVRDLYGSLGTADPTAWVPERLEYDLQATAPLPDGSHGVYSAHPDRDAEFDWYTFDLNSRSTSPSTGQPPAAVVKRSFLPGHVRFRGMPNARWWDFESGTVNFGAIDTDRREITKLLLADFMLVHSNDWFMIPLDVEVNTLTQIASLTVLDTFGFDTVIPSAGVSAVPAERWTMFTNTDLTGTSPSPPASCCRRARRRPRKRATRSRTCASSGMKSRIWSGRLNERWKGKLELRSMPPGARPHRPSHRFPRLLHPVRRRSGTKSRLACPNTGFHFCL